MKKIRLINSRTVFIATLVIIPTLVLIVFLTGLENHRSLYLNSLISTTILSTVLIGFLTIGLYNGWKLKDTVGKFNLRYKRKEPDGLSGMDAGGFDLPDGGDDIGGIILSMLLWIMVAILGSLILYYLGGLLWLTVLSIAAILYWVIFRAFRLIFKNSPACRGRLLKSFLIAIIYTLLYNFWIYGIILGVHYLRAQ